MFSSCWTWACWPWATTIAYAYFGAGFPPAGGWKATVVIALLTFTLFAGSTRLYQPWRGKRLRDEMLLLFSLASAALATVAVVATTLAILPEVSPKAPLFAAWLAVSLLLLEACVSSFGPAS